MNQLTISASKKQALEALLKKIKNYLESNLKLKVKDNWRVFPVEKIGIDFLGYKSFHNHILLRKTIKKNFARMLKDRPNQQSTASYLGWTKHCNSNNLMKKLFSNEQLQRFRHKATKQGV